jgi:hypothetical protein
MPVLVLKELKDRLKGAVIVCLAFIFLVAADFKVKQKPIEMEYQIKAVFLFNFAQFVEWPEKSFAHPKSPIVIGVLGKDLFGPYLDETIQNEEVNGHPLLVRRFKTISEVDTCHILFINPELTSKTAFIAKNLKGRNILTVSDGNNFTKQGGMVRIFRDNNKIKLRINLDAVKAEDLTISSKILSLAEIVNAK